jgi:hypothetical protein
MSSQGKGIKTNTQPAVNTPYILSGLITGNSLVNSLSVEIYFLPAVRLPQSYVFYTESVTVGRITMSTTFG